VTIAEDNDDTQYFKVFIRFYHFLIVLIKQV